METKKNQKGFLDVIVYMLNLCNRMLKVDGKNIKKIKRIGEVTDKLSLQLNNACSKVTARFGGRRSLIIQNQSMIILHYLFLLNKQTRIN